MIQPVTARLLPGAARLYPSLKTGTWYQVIREEPFGVFLLTGEPGHPERFVFRKHVELRNDGRFTPILNI